MYSNFFELLFILFLIQQPEEDKKAASAPTCSKSVSERLEQEVLFAETCFVLLLLALTQLDGRTFYYIIEQVLVGEY